MNKKPPMNKEEIQTRFQELCMVLGDLESKHQIHKAAVVKEINDLHFAHEQRVKAEAEEAEKQSPSAEKAE